MVRLHYYESHVRSFGRVDCDTDHYLVIAKVRERLAVGKQAAQRFERQMLATANINNIHYMCLYTEHVA